MGRSRRIAALAVAVIALSLSACGSTNATPSQARDAVKEAGLNNEQADCVERRFDDEFNQDQLNTISKADNLDSLETSLADKVRTILRDCTSPTSTTGSTGSTTTTSGAGTTTTAGGGTTTTTGGGTTTSAPG